MYDTKLFIGTDIFKMLSITLSRKAYKISFLLKIIYMHTHPHQKRSLEEYTWKGTMITSSGTGSSDSEGKILNLYRVTSEMFLFLICVTFWYFFDIVKKVPKMLKS